MKNQHPVKIFSYCSKNMWLLVFPLLRGLAAVRLMDFQGLYNWFSGAWFDIIIILFIFTAGLIRWKCTGFETKDDRIIYKSGVIFKNILEIPYRNITSFTVENKFYLRIFRASNVYIDTGSGRFQNNDLKITVYRKDIFQIQKKIDRYFSSFKEVFSGNYHYKYKPKWLTMVFFSFIFSNTLTGVIYTAVFFIKSGNIIEEIIQERMFDKISDVSKTVSEQFPIYISPVTVTIALIFIGGWLISFIINILRYTKFRIAIAGRKAEIHTGILTKRLYYINTEKINYIDLRQSIITKIFESMSINVSCSGYGNSRHEIPVLIPVMHKKQVISALKAMLPEAPSFHKIDYNPSIRFLWRYTWKSILLCVLFAVFYMAVDYIYPVYHEAYVFLLIMSEIPSLWFAAVSVISNRTSGISCHNGSICIKYSRGYVFYTVLASNSKIVKTTVCQSVFQKLTKTCDIILYINSESAKSHIVKSIKLEDAQKICSILNGEDSAVTD